MTSRTSGLGSGSAEYVNDVPYVRHFIADLAPARIRLAAAAAGIAPPPADDFDYCELGCAHGDTIAALAAAHPRSRFLGVDIGALHIASAKRLARDGGLENVGFFERDYADLLAEDIGEFDYVVAHGVLSWVSPASRKALVDFARAKLKPGGLLYVSYNAMPGWGAVEPLRQLLLSPPGQAPPGEGVDPGSSLERARRGLEFARAMEAAGAGYFVKNPSASEMLATMTRAGLPYVVHEYLHQHWSPMYFARVAWEMASADLHFAGALPLLLGFPETAIPESLEAALAGAVDRLTFESLKDFALNEFFRRDVYIRGKPTRSQTVTDAYFDATPWGTQKPLAALERSEELPHRTLRFDGPLFDALFEALAEGAASGATLAERPDLAEFGADKVRAALFRLLLAERIEPRLTEARTPLDIGATAYAVPLPYNQTMLRRLSSETPLVLAAPAAGTALPTAALEGLAMRVLVEAEPTPAAREAWVKAFVARSVVRLVDGDRVIADPAEQEKVILGKLAFVIAERLPKLVELGILEPAAAPARLR